jgi:hypothetical protein
LPIIHQIPRDNNPQMAPLGTPPWEAEEASQIARYAKINIDNKIVMRRYKSLALHAENSVSLFDLINVGLCFLLQLPLNTSRFLSIPVCLIFSVPFQPGLMDFAVVFWTVGRRRFTK